MKVLITGGCGFIGSNLAEELSKNHDVVILDNLSTGSLDNIKDFNVEFFKGDILDVNLLKKLIKDVDCVSHQAAVVSIPESIENPVRAEEVNVKGTINVLTASMDSGVDKVVNASSCAVYGDTPLLPVREDVPLNPKSPYAVTKLASEYHCNVFTEIFGINTISLRYFNVYGPRQNPDSEYAAVIPKFIQRAIKGEPLIIYGDGEQTRDFIYVKDVVRANIIALKSKKSGVFNVATGKRVSINELASLINQLVDVNSEPVYDKPREGEIRHSFGDITRIKDQLGFEPTYSMESGLKETIEWFEEKIESE